MEKATCFPTQKKWVKSESPQALSEGEIEKPRDFTRAVVPCLGCPGQLVDGTIEVELQKSVFFERPKIGCFCCHTFWVESQRKVLVYPSVVLSLSEVGCWLDLLPRSGNLPALTDF